MQFTASFCQPCKAIAPLFDALAKETSGIFARVDIEELDALALEQGVSALPAFHAYRNGVKTDTMMGQYEDRLRVFVKKNV